MKLAVSNHLAVCVLLVECIPTDGFWQFGESEDLSLKYHLFAYS